MGLDMYAYSRPTHNGAETDFPQKPEDEEIYYWRKHPDLHGWMEKLYREKGGSAESFNCVNVRLTIENLDRLEADLRGRHLPHTDGFFFGQSNGSEYDVDCDFIQKARACIGKGLTVYYSSWW